MTEGEDVILSTEEQRDLNTPPPSQEDVNEEDKKFMKLVLDLIERKELDLYQPSTFINHAVYDKLDEKHQKKVEFATQAIASNLRRAYELWEDENEKTDVFTSIMHDIR